MGVINIRTWRKSYMLEFLTNGTLTDCFTFALPPESEELQFTHRVSETKTFGGSVFDSYGEDAIHITLSGSTVNDEAKFIYHGKVKLPEYISGEAEIFTLQKVITDWHKAEAGKQKETYLYDLSKASILQIATGTATRNWWKVVIKDFKIKREKSNPRSYNYTLEMLGVEDKKGMQGSLLGTLSDAATSVKDVANKIKGIANKVQGVMAMADSVSSSVKKTIQKYARGNFDPFKLTTTLLFDGPMRIITGDNSNALYNSAKDAMTMAERFGWVSLTKDAKEVKSSRHENAQTYLITFASRGGSAVASQKAVKGSKVIKPVNPIRNGYSFTGWMTNTGALYDFSQEVKCDMTLMAGWMITSAVVTFHNENTITRATVHTGSAMDEPPHPTRTGYIFLHWSAEKNGVPFNWHTIIQGNLSLYAVWERYWTVTFDTKGGSAIAPLAVRLGRLPVCPMPPTLDNAVFVRWCTDELRTVEYDWSAPLQRDITLYADYAHSMNTVTFDTDGGTAIAAQVLTLGAAAVMPDTPSKDGYSFIEWVDEDGAHYDFSAIVTHSITLRAVWRINVYTVMFNSDNGAPLLSKDVEHNALAVPLYPTPSKDGYIFCGWQTEDGALYDWSVPVTSNITLKAAWTAMQ